MQIDIKDLNLKEAWIVGSKGPDETTFFVQIIEKFEHKQRLWQKFIDEKFDFYILPVKIGTSINTDNTPF